MPRLTGLQAARSIRMQAPEVAVLMLSMHDDERYLFEALKAGAAGYVLKHGRARSSSTPPVPSCGASRS